MLNTLLIRFVLMDRGLAKQYHQGGFPNFNLNGSSKVRSKKVCSQSVVRYELLGLYYKRKGERDKVHSVDEIRPIAKEFPWWQIVYGWTKGRSSLAVTRGCHKKKFT